MDSEETKTDYAEPEDDTCQKINIEIASGLCEKDTQKLREGGY